jgi:hypothetical protein
MSIGFKYHEMVGNTVKKSGLSYVLARPIRFVEKPSSPLHFYANKGDDIGVFKTISRASVASFLLDAADKDGWNSIAPVISN